ncbi:MAG: tetratricopeptide repeat protein [Persicimonas sp.]
MNFDDTEVWSLARLGFLFYSRGRLEEAGAIFHGLVQIRPVNAYSWYALGLVRREQGAFRGAVECLNEAISCDPKMWRARAALAELLYAHGYKQDAGAVLEPLLGPSAPADEPAVRRGRVLWRCWND